MKNVWIADPEQTFVKAQLLADNRVQLPDGTVKELPETEIFQVNPPQFDRANDIAELTFLNEASVVHNLSSRYGADSIYTYSGLFLVAVNPYKQLALYGQEMVDLYAAGGAAGAEGGAAAERAEAAGASKGAGDADKAEASLAPHIYAVADTAYRQLLSTHSNQSILITGESGAGKTENTKKTIQYLSAITSQKSTTERKILQTNPVLEAFGNAQTVRNNNSSRFGKFIRIEFRGASICGALIDWYLLEKSRVIKQGAGERNYHIFYYLVRGATPDQRKSLGLTSNDPKEYALLNGTDTIEGVDDAAEFETLLGALRAVGFSSDEVDKILLVVAAVLHLGNIEVTAMTTDQGRIPQMEQVRKATRLLGVKDDVFADILVKPKIKAGRELVQKAVSAPQIRGSINALAMALYERLFGYIVSRLNDMLGGSAATASTTNFIGVLDIAGFEIFTHNSFEQLCINYTNEKLQQFFNHHMFVLEQAEYVKEEIEWEYVDYGSDLQPTIDLIEKQNPMGIFACLDEDCVMPRATDKSFTEKLAGKWTDKPKFKASRLNQGFVVSHYAAQVEYETDGWLEKNKDPLNEQVVSVLREGKNDLLKKLFDESVLGGPAGASGPAGGAKSSALSKTVKKGMFRTVAQRHKEQLGDLMAQLAATHPHFVRCIVPNQHKAPGEFDNKLVLDQLRCNGVLEGIRIARSGFPNRVEFKEFKERYQALMERPRQFGDDRAACEAILRSLQLNPAGYKVGTSKVFFKNGVLAELEEIRDQLVAEQTVRVQALARGFVVRRELKRQVFRDLAAKTLASTARVHLRNRDNNWWKLYQGVRPMLSDAESKENNRKDVRIQRLEENLERVRADHSRLDGERAARTAELETVTQKLQDAEAKLQGTEEKLESLHNELDAVKLSHSDALAAAVAAHDTTKEQLKGVKAEHKEMLAKHDEVKAKHADIAKEHTELQTKHSDMAKKHRDLQTEHADITKKHKELQAAHTELEKSQSAAAKHARESKVEAERLNSEVKELKSEVERLTKQVDTATKARDSAIKELESVKTERDAAKKELDTTKKELDTHKNQFSARVNEFVRKLEEADETSKKFKKRALDAETSLSEGSRSAVETAKELEASRSAAEAAKKELDTHKKELQSHKKDLDTHKREVAAAKKELEASRKELDNHKRVAAGELDKTIETHKRELKTVRGELDTHKREAAAHKKALESARGELDTHKSQLSTAQKDARGASATRKELESVRKELEVMKRAQGDAATAKRELKKAQDEAAAAKRELKRAQDDAAAAAAAQRELRSLKAERDAASTAATQRERDATAQRDAAVQREKTLQSQLDVLRKELTTQKSSSREAEYKSQADSLAAKVASLKSELDLLRTQAPPPSDLLRQLEKTQREKAEIAAQNSRLMFAASRSASGASASGVAPSDVSRDSNVSRGLDPRGRTEEVGAADGSSATIKKLESELKLLKLRLVKSERDHKIALSKARGHDGDELLKERDDAVRALEALRAGSGAGSGSGSLDIRKRRPLRTISNERGSQGSPKDAIKHANAASAAPLRTSSRALKDAIIADLNESLSESAATVTMYRQRANDYQSKIEQAQVIMKNLKLSEESLTTELEELKQRQSGLVQDKDKELALKNDTIRRLRRELEGLKQEYRDHIVLDSSQSRATAQNRMSELIASLNEITSERDLLLNDKLKLEKRLSYAWASESDPRDRQRELEDTLRQTKREFSSAQHELAELKSRSDLNASRLEQYQHQLQTYEHKMRRQAEELEQLRDEGFDSDLRLKQMTREFAAMREENLRLRRSAGGASGRASGASAFI